MQESSSKSHLIAYLSSFPPRECGIATFTQDLTTAMDAAYNPAIKSTIIAINEDESSIYNYPKKVKKSISAHELPSYVTLAKNLNRDENIKLINIEHEFGLFGGEWGDYLIPFLQVVEKPMVITFHSVIPNPEENLKKTVQLIISKIKTAIVMNQLSADILENQYQIPKSKIQIIPHGIPSAAFESSAAHKTELDLENRIVLSSFGLLSRNKGVEYFIRALPKIVKNFPNAIYLILGETHPVIRRNEGESYRNFLMKEVERLNLKNHVKFYNKYLSLEEIIKFLKSSDIYISPTTDTNQSVSGTLSYALGCGRPIISTTTSYAKYLLKEDNTGILVRPKNSGDFTKAVISLLNNPQKIKVMSVAAYEASRHMTWPNVAAQHFKIYQKIADLVPENKLPPIKMDHVIRMTDAFGIFHHAKYSTPEPRYGYSLDDNARALIACVDYYKISPSPTIANLIKTYLNFIKSVANSDGSFSNIVSRKKIIDRTKDEDVQGRNIWALAHASCAHHLPEEIQKEAFVLYRGALSYLPKLSSPRAVSFAINGLRDRMACCSSNHEKEILKKFANTLIDAYKERASLDWQWFEDHLTYSNSKLPEALYQAYEILQQKIYLTVAEKTLDFLTNITFDKDHYAPIGQNGWYFRNKKRAYFDQQPEDSASMVQTKIIAYEITKNRKHLDDAFSAFRWFLGDNHIHQMVYNESTGGCHDGVGEHSINLNQGAESTISYLMARLAFEKPEIKTFFL